MSSEPVVIQVSHLGKNYHIYSQPKDRLKQFLLPRLNRMIGRKSGNYFREFWALHDVSFEVTKGETVGIIGRNGSGKSTLLQMICGTLTPTEGTVNIQGRIAALLELGTGFNPDFTGRENVYMNGAVLGLSTQEIDARFDDISAFAEIGDFIEQPVKTYSSGMMVRLAFAVIAHADADILVIDEALAVGDAFFTQKCMRFLRTFMKTGTIFFVSHDLMSVKSLCDSAIWLEKGRILKKGSPKEVCEAYLESYYEAQQGKGILPRAETKTKSESTTVLKDQRLQFINKSSLRNDLELFKFDPDAAGFGKGGAHITDVELLDQDGSPLSWVVGGETVILRINAIAHEPIDAAIVGFFVKDRLGQTLFGDNTYLSYMDSPVYCDPGDKIAAEFSFLMPIFPSGDYSINVAIGDGAQEQHVQHHFVHDAKMFRSESGSSVGGLLGIPMQGICLDIIAKDDNKERDL